MNGMRSFDLNPRDWVEPAPPDAVLRHARHGMSRRAFLGSIGTAGAVAGVGLLSLPALAAKPSNAAPKPTANTFTIGGKTFHFTFFGPGIDPSSIYDFNGFVGVADVQGTGTGTNPDGSTETLLFDTDMRFMSGVYVGLDGAVHKGAFAFV
jgi:hypothetical protein